MFKFFFKIILIIILCTKFSYSKNYTDILINGNIRISDESIILFSEISKENSLDENSLNEILKRLYESGFFKNVSVLIENKNLIIDVLENPIIQTVFIDGIDRKQTKESLYEIISLKNRSSYDLALVKKDETTMM